MTTQYIAHLFWNFNVISGIFKCFEVACQSRNLKHNRQNVQDLISDRGRSIPSNHVEEVFRNLPIDIQNRKMNSPIMAACSASFASSSRPYPALNPGFFRSLYSHRCEFFVHQPQAGWPLLHFTLRCLHVSHDTLSGRVVLRRFRLPSTSTCPSLSSLQPSSLCGERFEFGDACCPATEVIV